MVHGDHQPDRRHPHRPGRHRSGRGLRRSKAIGILAQPAPRVSTCSSPTATTPTTDCRTRQRSRPRPNPAGPHHEATGPCTTRGDRDHDCADDARGLSAGSERDRADAETDDDGCGLSPSASEGTVTIGNAPRETQAGQPSSGRASLIMDPPPGWLGPEAAAAPGGAALPSLRRRRPEPGRD